MAGAEILQAACDAQKCIIAIERDKNDAIATLRSVLDDSKIELRLLQPMYPIGNEKRLIELFTGREIPAGEFAGSIGVACFNAGTTKAVYDAVVLDRPLISRITTVCGDTLRTPDW